LIEADKETDENNYLQWRVEKGVAEGSTEIPKGASSSSNFNYHEKQEMQLLLDNLRVFNITSALVVSIETFKSKKLSYCCCHFLNFGLLGKLASLSEAETGLHIHLFSVTVPHDE